MFRYHLCSISTSNNLFLQITNFMRGYIKRIIHGCAEIIIMKPLECILSVGLGYHEWAKRSLSVQYKNLQ